MPDTLINPHRGKGLLADIPRAKDDPSGVVALLAQCPAHAPTPLRLIEDRAADLFFVDDQA